MAALKFKFITEEPQVLEPYTFYLIKNEVTEGFIITHSDPLVPIYVGDTRQIKEALAGFATLNQLGEKANKDSPTFTGTATIPDIAATKLSTIKTATFGAQHSISATSGAITLDWTAGQNKLQTKPIGAITYTFTNPIGPCHLQLLIASDGSSTAQAITWPATVKWLGSAWVGAANKAAIINFWYDGTNYWAMGGNQV